MSSNFNAASSNDKPTKNTPDPPMPEADSMEAMTEQAKRLLKSGLDLFEGQARHFADDLAEFNARQKQARERIEHGGRRASGRIV